MATFIYCIVSSKFITENFMIAEKLRMRFLEVGRENNSFGRIPSTGAWGLGRRLRYLISALH